MQTIQSGARSLGLIFDLNWDRLLYSGAIAGSLGLATWVASLI
ncbi:MAG: hypothetical protein AAF636_06725 [Pseudomonadota bacterium]